MGVDGQLERKHKGNFVNQNIFAEFTKGAKSAHDAVAYYITQNDDGTIAIQYLDTQGLREFLNSNTVNNGCLQKFVPPRGNHNSTIQAHWSPQLCLIERRVSLQRLDARRVPLQERCCTCEYEGGAHLSRATPVRGKVLQRKVQQLCRSITSHVRTTSHHRISRLLLNLKSDAQDRVWLLWCASVRLAPPESPAGAAAGTRAVAGTGTAASTGVAADAGAAADAAPPPALLAGQRVQPVCLQGQVEMASPERQPQQRPDGKGICPFTRTPLHTEHEYFVTYKSIIDHNHRLSNAALVGQRGGGPDTSHSSGPSSRVPPLLLHVCPEMTNARYAVERVNPMFLFRRVPVSEEAFLELTAGATPGHHDPWGGSAKTHCADVFKAILGANASHEGSGAGRVGIGGAGALDGLPVAKAQRRGRDPGLRPSSSAPQLPSIERRAWVPTGLLGSRRY